MKWNRAGVFVACGLALHALLFLVYTTLIGPGHKTTRSDEAFLRGPDHIEVLIAGDSHPRTALAPWLMGPGVVNAAVGGEHYLKTWYRLRKLLAESSKQVDTLLLPLDAGSFSTWHADNFAPEYVWGRYVDFQEVGRLRGEPWKFTTLWAKGRLVPYAGELRTLNQIRTKRFGFGDELPNGAFGARPELERRGIALTQAKEHFKGQEILEPSLVWAFHQLLDWATEQDIQIVLVSFPVSRDYGFWADKAGARARVRDEILQPLLADDRVMYFDDTELFWDKDNAFSDPHHLNGPGRAVYSRQMSQRLADAGLLVSGPVPPR